MSSTMAFASMHAYPRRRPGTAAIRIGPNPASVIYKRKESRANAIEAYAGYPASDATAIDGIIPSRRCLRVIIDWQPSCDHSALYRCRAERCCAGVACATRCKPSRPKTSARDREPAAPADHLPATNREFGIGFCLAPAYRDGCSRLTRYEEAFSPQRPGSDCVA